MRYSRFFSAFILLISVFSCKRKEPLYFDGFSRNSTGLYYKLISIGDSKSKMQFLDDFHGYINDLLKKYWGGFTNNLKFCISEIFFVHLLYQNNLMAKNYFYSITLLVFLFSMGVNAQDNKQQSKTQPQEHT